MPTELSHAEILARHRVVWKQGYGSVAADELYFIQSLIKAERPKRFVEIGTASGLSTGMIAQFLDAHGGAELVSVDIDDIFFGDRSQPTGFLVDRLYPGGAVSVDLRQHQGALDIAGFPGPYEMAFVDANHQHPWPAIDMMALYPHMVGNRTVIHHDLRLFMTEGHATGIGPKYLYDQFPEAKRTRSTARQGNIFCVDLRMGPGDFEQILTNLFKLPWSLLEPLDAASIDKVRAVLSAHYTPALGAHFERCLALYNHPPRGQRWERVKASWPMTPLRVAWRLGRRVIGR